MLYYYFVWLGIGAFLDRSCSSTIIFFFLSDAYKLKKFYMC